jgi:predicted RNase H-like HicB family nuclease
MRFYSFQIIIEKEPEEEGYFAYSPTVPGCFSNGTTIEETKRNIRQAIEQHLASMLAHCESCQEKVRVYLSSAFRPQVVYVKFSQKIRPVLTRLADVSGMKGAAK